MSERITDETGHGSTSARRSDSWPLEALACRSMAQRSRRPARAPKGRTRTIRDLMDAFLAARPQRSAKSDDLDPASASALARPGWIVNCVVGRLGDTWQVLETGNVYPETLA